MKLNSLSLGLCVTFAILSFSGAASASGEVRLLRATSTVSHAYHWDAQSASFDIRVNDAACGGDVAVHMTSGTGSWMDVPASYLRPAGAGHSVYRASFGAGGGSGVIHDIEFVVRCGTGNSTYWDNNGWQNYFIGQGAGTILTSGNVYGTGYTASQGTYQGKMTSSVTLRNLAYAKQVKVVYTTDDWATVREAYASYSPSFWAYTTTPNPNAAGFEEWSFSLDVGDASSVEYAIAYTALGQTYWDNNFGENYVTNLSSY